MKKILGLAALAALSLASLSLGSAARAQAPNWSGQYDEPPRGTYTRSCREISAFRGEVWALCQTERGGWSWSSARTRDCGAQGLENQNGRLQCVGYNGGGNGGGWNNGGGNNGGGWNNGGGSGGWNNGGGGGGNNNGGRPPGGGYRGDVLLFENTGYQGRVYEVVGDMPDLSVVNFNDKASSIKIQRGKWEICEHANYQGRCSRLDADQVVLPREWNDQITSIRRVK